MRQGPSSTQPSEINMSLGGSSVQEHLPVSVGYRPLLLQGHNRGKKGQNPTTILGGISCDSLQAVLSTLESLVLPLLAQVTPCEGHLSQDHFFLVPSVPRMVHLVSGLLLI